MILDGNKVSNYIYENIKDKFKDLKDKYIVIFLLNDHKPSKIFVNKKVEFGKKLGFNVVVYENYKASYDEVINKIGFYNQDPNCIGIVIQLPLPDYLKKYQEDFLYKIDLNKDIDFLGKAQSLMFKEGDYGTATARACIKLFDYYGINLEGKKIAILSQSNLIGKPLSILLMKRKSCVFVFNEFCDYKEYVKKCDILISATGKPGLIDQSYVNENMVVIDVGFEYVNDRIVGDIKDIKVKAICPAKGGIGPITVACLFENILNLTYNNI